MIDRAPLDAAMQIQRERYHRGEITKEELRMRAREIYEPLVAELIALGPPKNVIWIEEEEEQ